MGSRPARFFRCSTQRFLAASRRMPHNSIIAQQRQLYRDLLPRAAHTKVSNPEQAGPDFREVWNRIGCTSIKGHVKILYRKRARAGRCKQRSTQAGEGAGRSK